MKLGHLLFNIIRSLLAIGCSLLALVVFAIGLIVMASLQKLVPGKTLKKHLSNTTVWVALGWPIQNHWVLRYLTRIDWQITGRDCIELGKNYIVIANHQSWSDIPVLEEAIYQRTGLSRYFIKKALLNTPLVGWICRALEFPAMHRFSKSMLLKNPRLKGKDTEATRQSCLRLKESHFSLNNFIEGTRFTLEKQRCQQSPYRYLLKPKAGGLAAAINLLHEQVAGILNVTITYVGTPKTMWGVYTSQVKKIIISVEKIVITPELIGNYEEDREFRVSFQAWLNDLWLKKDHTIAAALNEEKS